MISEGKGFCVLRLVGNDNGVGFVLWFIDRDVGIEFVDVVFMEKRELGLVEVMM